ncbi:MAG: preprotein translocase subunit SecG [Syntrophobacterales bacterium]|jgi:preprotein translocase subunit SecG|nr:preprotein translocase subunit SecG [Syntrophobacterales bacterium]
MRPLLIVLHIMICLVLIVVVLLQAGKGAGMGAAFGGASQTVFGAAGAGTFLTKMTTVIAILFMLTTLGLSYFSQERTSSVVRDYAPPKAAESTPVNDPAAQAPAPAAAPEGKAPQSPEN